MLYMKWFVISWTLSEGTLVGIYHNKDAAIAAAKAVSLTGGVIGAGIIPIEGSTSMEVIEVSIGVEPGPPIGAQY